MSWTGLRIDTDREFTQFVERRPLGEEYSISESGVDCRGRVAGNDMLNPVEWEYRQVERTRLRRQDARGHERYGFDPNNGALSSAISAMILERDRALQARVGCRTAIHENVADHLRTFTF